MTSPSPRRNLVLAAVVATLVLVFTACGASGPDKSAGTTTTTTAATTTTTTEATTTTSGDHTTTTEGGGSTTTPGDGSDPSSVAKDAMKRTFQQMGMTEKQATCASDYAFEKLGDLSTGDLGNGDLGKLQSFSKDVLKKCHIKQSQLKLPNTLGGGN